MNDDLSATLDRVEKCPEHYERLAIIVETAQGPRRGFAFRARPEMTTEGLIPSQNYINHILTAAEFFSDDYRERLENTPTYSGECAACHKVRTVLFRKEKGQMFVLCPSCLEAKGNWGAVRGRPFSILDTEAVIQHLSRTGQGYESLQDVVADALRLGLIEP